MLLTRTVIPGCCDRKKAVAGSQTELKIKSVNEESRTTCGDVASSDHTTEVLAALMAHSRRASDCLDPKKSVPDGVENDDTTDDISDGVMEPKIASSNTGMDSMDLKSISELAGGTIGEVRRYWTRAVATLTSGMDDKKFSMT